MLPVKDVQRLVEAHARTSFDLETLGKQLESKIDRVVDAQAQTSTDLGAIRDYLLKKVDDPAEKVQSSAVQTATNASSSAASQEQLVNYLKTTSELQMSLIKSLISTIKDVRRSDVAAIRNQVTDLQNKLDAQTETVLKLSS